MDFQGRVRRVWSIHCPQEVLLSSTNVLVVSYFFNLVGFSCQVSCELWLARICVEVGSVKDGIVPMLMYYSFSSTWEACLQWLCICGGQKTVQIPSLPSLVFGSTISFSRVFVVESDWDVFFRPYFLFVLYLTVLFLSFLGTLILIVLLYLKFYGSVSLWS